jgi:nitrate/nitrite-specific signal transduction histidine kinase
MLERARNLGGEVSFKGAAGSGTTVAVRLPLENAQQAPAPQRQSATDMP